MNSPNARGALIVLLLLAVLSVRAAFAQSGGARIVLIDRGSEELARKIRAEAEHLGFEVLAAAEGGAHNEALAVVRVASAESVEITIGGPQPELRSLERRSTEGEAFALRVVEELRGRLVELKLLTPAGAPAPTASATAPPAPTPAPAQAPLVQPTAPVVDRPPPSGPRRTPRIWVRAGLSGLAPLGGIDPTGHALLGIGAEPFDDAWGLSAFALLPVTENELAEPEGEADVGVNVYALELAHFASLSDDGAWFATVGAGGGLLVLALRAEPQPEYAANQDSLLAGIYYAHVGAGRQLAPWLRVRLSLFGGASAPRPVVRFADRDVAAWGRAFGGLAVGADLGVPLERRGQP